MKVYQYNDENLYIGEIEAQIDPLESEKAGQDIFLLPANCTWKKPPKEKEGFLIKWNGEKWTQDEIKKQETEPTYQEKRAAEYPYIGDQLDMIYWDKVNGTNNWQETIAAIKAKYPKE